MPFCEALRHLAIGLFLLVLDRSYDPRSFANGKDLVCGNLRESFHLLSRRPLDLDRIDRAYSSKSKVKAEVAL